jgi:UDP:flavonoid glycosyltransferase YjiC (YdhE family)
VEVERAVGRVLLAPETFNLGETTRGVEVARALRARGHDVHFMGYSDRYGEHIRGAGFDLHLADPRLTDREADQLLAFDQGRSLRHPFTESVVRARVATEIAVISTWRPGAVVIGSTMTMLISARACAVPLAYVKPYALSRGHLATMSTLPVLRGDGLAATAVNSAAGRLTRRLARDLRWVPRSFLRVAAENGVPLPRRTVDALASDLDLIASLFPALDRRPLAPGERAVGPVYACAEGSLPDSVTALAEARRPLVYVGMGSSAGRDLVLGVLHQLGRADVDVLTTTGRYLGERDVRDLPGNVRVFDFLPAHRLSGLIDASIIHGGEGTVQTACASGRPFAGIGLQLEQRWNVDECVRAGNALRFTASDVRRDRMVLLARRLLGDERLQAAARRVAALGQSLDGAERSADHIVGLLRDRSGAGGEVS